MEPNTPNTTTNATTPPVQPAQPSAPEPASVPPVQTPPKAPQAEGGGKSWLVVGGALLVVVLGVLLFLSFSGGSSTGEERVGDTVYKKTDLSKVSGADAVPAGLPPGLPLETDRVLESTVSENDAGDYTLSTFAYESTIGKEEVYTKYRSYLVTYGFKITSASTEPGPAGVYSIAGTREGDDLMAVVSADGGVTKVQVTYLNRQ